MSECIEDLFWMCLFTISNLTEKKSSPYIYLPAFMPLATIERQEQV
jgi:hypothetical protein